MKKYKFTLTFKQGGGPWIYTTIIEADNIQNAYYHAFASFAMHICMWEAMPNRLEISYIEL